MPSLVCTRMYSAVKSRPKNGSSCSNARLNFQDVGCLKFGSIRSTLDLGGVPTGLNTGWLFGSELNVPGAQAAKAVPRLLSVPQPMMRVVMPLLVKALDR